MKLITEVVEDLKCITEAREDGKKNVYIEGIFLQGGIKNRNGRMYPVETLEKEVNRYDETYIQKGRALGELGHPDGPSINLDRVSHMITSLKKEGPNFVGRAKLMDTPMGNIAKGLIGEGVKLGVSSRGMGSLKLNREGINEVQDDFFKPTIQAVISVPQAAPEGSILRTENVIDMLERTKLFNLEWVRKGHRKGANTNNVSATVSVQENEWEQVGNWMWENKETFNGLSVLPYFGGSYMQAPFEDITKEQFDEMAQHLHNIDLSKIVEFSDETNLSESVACAGGACEIV